MSLRDEIRDLIVEHTDADTNDANFAADRILAIPAIKKALLPYREGDTVTLLDTTKTWTFKNGEWHEKPQPAPSISTHSEDR